MRIPPEKRKQFDKIARELVRDSIIEKASVRFVSQIIAETLALRSGTDTDYVCVRREELEKALRSAALLVQHVDLEMPSPPPGWFADCRDDIAAIRQKLAAKD